MKRSFILLAVLLATTNAVFAQRPALKDATAEVVRGAASGRLGVIDPAVTDLRFAILKESTGNRMRVSATVKNLGLQNYESNDNQQVIQLWEESSSNRRVLVKSLPFRNLMPGATLTITYERPAFKPADEFPPFYKAIIVYDPDIRSDNNKNNDDANLANNSMTKNPRD